MLGFRHRDCSLEAHESLLRYCPLSLFELLRVREVFVSDLEAVGPLLEVIVALIGDDLPMPRVQEGAAQNRLIFHLW